MASGGRRRKPLRGSNRPKTKKKTKYLSLSRIIKADVETPEDDDGPASSPSPAWENAEVKKEDGGGQQQVEPFALHHEASTLFAAFPAPSLSDILGASTDGVESPVAVCVPWRGGVRGRGGGGSGAGRAAGEGPMGVLPQQQLRDVVVVAVLVRGEHGRLGKVAAAQAGLRGDPGRLGRPRVLYIGHAAPRRSRSRTSTTCWWRWSCRSIRRAGGSVTRVERAGDGGVRGGGECEAVQGEAAEPSCSPSGSGTRFAGSMPSSARASRAAS